MKQLLILLFLYFSFSDTIAQRPEYPVCPKHAVTDTFFNAYTVTENYRWLENVHDTKVREWIKEEENLSDKFTNRASSKYACKTLIDKYSYIRSSHPVKSGKYYFTFYYRNKLASPVLYMGDDPEEVDYPLVDPNFNTKNDKVDIQSYAVSRDSKYLCYLINRNGTDWREARVVSLPSGTRKRDHILGIKYSSIAWMNDGFFYSKYPYEGEFKAAFGEEVYYHKLGDEQAQDKLIFKRKSPNAQFSFRTTSDEQFFVLQEETPNYYNYFFIDYSAKQPYLRPLLMKQKSKFNVLDSHNGKLICRTFKDNNGGSIVEIDPYAPYQWRQVVPELQDGVLLICKVKQDRLICIYQSNQHPIVKIFDYQAHALYQLELPEASSVNGFSGEIDDEDLIFYNQQYTTPSLCYHFNTKTFQRKPGKTTKVTFYFQNYEYKSISYPVNDSINVPMTIVYKKGLKLNGNNPCLLKAYGGFGAISTPSFDPGIVYFIEQGGIYAFANIRGGGDLGKEWAKAGKGLHKQNSIDDFNAAAEFLIKEKYTNPKKLASTGGSHGGLIVAAAAIQRPDLYAAVVPVVGVMDMIHFEDYTVGNFHTDEFGTVRDSVDFLNLRSYSPLHNIKEEVNYPAMLVMTSENDDRVPPFHSYKFVARLQNREKQLNPIFLRVEKDAGHYGAINHSKYTKGKGAMYGFIMRILMG
ncbi:prolyl oligopeptidase family serine peptidase [Ancylomarina longa]|uniref:prolyl oligopeptidase n=1 Tax=Ancylomarina longa TaxID=2487017 RepID=A0A434AYY3_9BACT|nr:prolyl oligopeptidase family serine peptidase [Ancylomarina longa]RUT79706.1 S9 family peptidase [Ancylomarina longa]